MVGAMYYYSHVNYSADENADFILLMNNIGHVRQWQAGVGLGYGGAEYHTQAQGSTLGRQLPFASVKTSGTYWSAVRSRDCAQAYLLPGFASRLQTEKCLQL